MVNKYTQNSTCSYFYGLSLTIKKLSFQNHHYNDTAVLPKDLLDFHAFGIRLFDVMLILSIETVKMRTN